MPEMVYSDNITILPECCPVLDDVMASEAMTYP